MLLAFDWSSWYGYLLAIAAGLGAVLTILGFVGWLGGAIRWFLDWWSPPDPDIVLGRPRVEMFTITPHTELAPGEKRRVRTMSPAYLIENKGDIGIRDLKTGVRTFDGVAEHEFTAFHVPLLEAGRTIDVTGVGNVPEALLRDVHESAPADGLLYLARFTHRGALREAVYDPHTRSHTYPVLRRRRLLAR